jgi:hypothetical protein
MNPTEERDFHTFADAVVPRLLPVAYALTGNQLAAERLVTGALARVARDWHRLDGDPAAQATRFLYRAYVDGRAAAGPLELYTVEDPAGALRRLRHAALRQLSPARGPCWSHATWRNAPMTRPPACSAARPKRSAAR